MAVANDATFYGPPVGLPDGQLELNGQSWAAGGQLGLTYAPTETIDDRARLDGAGRSRRRVRHLCEGPASGAGHAAATRRSRQSSTSRCRSSSCWDLRTRQTNETTLALGLSWQDWSEFGESKLKLPGYSAPMIRERPAGHVGCFHRRAARVRQRLGRVDRRQLRQQSSNGWRHGRVLSGGRAMDRSPPAPSTRSTKRGVCAQSFESRDCAGRRNLISHCLVTERRTVSHSADQIGRVSTGAKPPPAVRKFVVCPRYRRADRNQVSPCMT